MRHLFLCLSSTYSQRLRQIKSVTVRSEAERTSLQKLIISLAVSITNCGSDLNYLMGVNSPSKPSPFWATNLSSTLLTVRYIYVNVFEKRLLVHVNVFIKKREELQKLIESILSLRGVRTSSSMKDITGKIKNLKTNETPQQAENRFHLFKARFLARLRTKEEAEAVLLIRDRMPNVKEDPKGAQSQFQQIYLEFVCKEDLYEQAGYVTEVLPKVLKEEGSKKFGTDASSHFPRFNKLLDMQNRTLELNLARIQTQTQQMRQFDMKAETPFIISVPTLAGGKRYILLNTPTTPKDPVRYIASICFRHLPFALRQEVHRIWTLMVIFYNLVTRKDTNTHPNSSES